VTQWRVELGAEDLASLSRGEDITVTALDEDSELPDDSIEVIIAFREY